MNVQFHHCDKTKELKVEKMKPIENYNAKPRGGFWTSTYEEGYGSDWVQWLIGESDEEKQMELTGYLLTTKKEANLYVVDSFEDCKKLLQEYLYINPAFEPLIKELRDKHQYKDEQLHQFFGIDYEKMQEKYDGFHLTRNGFIDCHLKVGECNLSIFNGFDCESTVWFNWCFEKIEYMESTANAKADWDVYEIARKNNTYLEN